MFFWYCWRLVIWSFCSREIPYTNIKHYILFANREKTDRIHLKLVWRCGSQTVFLVLFSFFRNWWFEAPAQGEILMRISEIMFWSEIWKKRKKQHDKWQKRYRGTGVQELGPWFFWSSLKLELQNWSSSFNELQRASLSSFIFCEALKNQKNEKNWIVNYLRGSDFQRKHSTLNYS